MTIQEQIESLKKQVNSMLTPDTPKETIDLLGSISNSLDDVSKEHQKTVDELHDMKDLYIKAIRKEGSSEKPKEETSNPAPKTMEEIAQEVIAQRKS